MLFLQATRQRFSTTFPLFALCYPSLHRWHLHPSRGSRQIPGSYPWVHFSLISFPHPHQTPSKPCWGYKQILYNIPLPQASPLHQGQCSQSLLDPWLLLLPSCILSSSRLAKPFENLSQITSLSYLKPIRASCCSQSTNHTLGRGCDLAAASQAPSPAALTTHFLSPPLKPWNIPHTLWQLHGSFSAWQFLLRKTFLNHPL